MALASLNLAASNLSALAAKLAPTSLSTLIPAKLAAIPVVAGLVVGTAAGASFVTSPAYEPAAKAPQLAVSTLAVMPAAAVPATPAPALAHARRRLGPTSTQVHGEAPRRRSAFGSSPRPAPAKSPMRRRTRRTD